MIDSPFCGLWRVPASLLGLAETTVPVPALKQSQSLVNACKMLRTCESAKCYKLFVRIDHPGMFGIIKTSPLDREITPALVWLGTGWYFYFFPPHFVLSQAKIGTISQPSRDMDEHREHWCALGLAGSIAPQCAAKPCSPSRCSTPPQKPSLSPLLPSHV